MTVLPRASTGHGGVITMDPFTGQHMGADQRDPRHPPKIEVITSVQRRRCGAPREIRADRRRRTNATARMFPRWRVKRQI